MFEKNLLLKVNIQNNQTRNDYRIKWVLYEVYIGNYFNAKRNLISECTFEHYKTIIDYYYTYIQDTYPCSQFLHQFHLLSRWIH